MAVPQVPPMWWDHNQLALWNLQRCNDQLKQEREQLHRQLYMARSLHTAQPMAPPMAPQSATGTIGQEVSTQVRCDPPPVQMTRKRPKCKVTEVEQDEPPNKRPCTVINGRPSKKIDPSRSDLPVTKTGPRRKRRNRRRLMCRCPPGRRRNPPQKPKKDLESKKLELHLDLTKLYG